MIKPKISIIVPVYNSQSTLGFCLNSATCQTYSNIEIIIVNDGSTDGSLAICENYAVIYDSVQVFCQANGGVSKARNTGLQKATGEYILFLDSDDELEESICEELLHVALEKKAELVVCGHWQVLRNGNLCKKQHRVALPQKDALCLQGNEILQKLPCMFAETGLMEAPFAKLFCREMLLKNNIRYDENMAYGEDMVFNLQCYAAVKNLVVLPQTLYLCALENKESLSRKYLKNLLTTKIGLASELEKTVLLANMLTPKGEECLMQYKASGILNGLLMLYHPSCPLIASEKEAYVSPLIAGGEIEKTFAAAQGANSAFKDLLPFATKQDVKGLLLQVAIISGVVKKQQSFANGLVRKGLKMLQFGDGRLAKWANKLENEILLIGVKNAIKRLFLGVK